MAAQDRTGPDPGASRSYQADDIEVLSHCEHVRRYPCLFIGEMGRRGLQVLLDFPGDHFCRGLIAIVAVWMDEPSFSGATKDKMVNPTAEAVIAREAGRQLTQLWEQQPVVVDAIVQQALVDWEEIQVARLLAHPGQRRRPRM